MKIKLNNTCKIQEILDVILFSLSTSVSLSLCLEVISAMPNLGAIQLSFPSSPAPRLLSTAGKLIKSSQLIPLQVNNFHT